MLSLQRCGQTLTADWAGAFAHEQCHTQIATIYGTDQQLDVSGGWHDAGDYGRYVPTGTKTVIDLMLAYQMNPHLFTDAKMCIRDSLKTLHIHYCNYLGRY